MRVSTPQIPIWEFIGGEAYRKSAADFDKAFAANKIVTDDIAAGKTLYIYHAIVRNIKTDSVGANKQSVYGILQNVTTGETLFEMAADVGDSIAFLQPIVVKGAAQIRLTAYQYGETSNLFAFTIYGWKI